MERSSSIPEERVQLSLSFYADEFWCRHCQKLNLHPGFLESLQWLRGTLRKPMHPTSGCRCQEYNTLIKGHPRSLHVLDHAQYPGQAGTLAVDIAAVDGAYRGLLFSLAWEQGWSIGWNAARGFLHLDRRDWLGLPQTSFDY